MRQSLVCLMLLSFNKVMNEKGKTGNVKKLVLIEPIDNTLEPFDT